MTPPRKRAKPRGKYVEVCILKCQCCKELAISIGGKRVTNNRSGGPWEVVLDQWVELNPADWAEGKRK